MSDLVENVGGIIKVPAKLSKYVRKADDGEVIRDFEVFCSNVEILLKCKDDVYDKLNDEYKKALKEVGRLQGQMKKNESSRGCVARFILGLRSIMDSTMVANFPEWILTSHLSFVDQWRIMFRLTSRTFVKIFQMRLKNYGISEEKFYDGLKFFRAKMNVEFHLGEIPEFPDIRNEKEWNCMLRALNVKNHADESTLKILTAEITAAENDQFKKKEDDGSEFMEFRATIYIPAMLFIKGFPLEYDENGIKVFLLLAPDVDTATKESTLKLIGPQYRHGLRCRVYSSQQEKLAEIEEVFIVKNDNGRSIGEAYVLVKTFQTAIQIYGSKNEYQFKKMTENVEGKSTETVFRTLKIERPILME